MGYAEASCLPFDDVEGYVLTVGYVLSAVVFLPLGLMDLKENAPWQISGFIVLLLCSLQFVTSFTLDGYSFDNLSLMGTQWNELLGVILFNFTFTSAVPAWLADKDPSVSVSGVIRDSTIMSVILYLLVGALGALAIPNISDNMLSSMIMGSYGATTQVSAFIFAVFIIGLGIPLFSVVTRLNLTCCGLCSHSMGNMLSVYLPWSISWMFYRGSAITKLLSWGGMLFSSVVAFLGPLALAYYVSKHFGKGHVDVWLGMIMTQESEVRWFQFCFVLGVLLVGVSLVGQFFAS